MRKKRSYRLKIVKDPIAGLQVLTAGPGAPKLTTKKVSEILEELREARHKRLLGPQGPRKRR
jgi:hypothetical protein